MTPRCPRMISPLVWAERQPRRRRYVPDDGLSWRPMKARCRAADGDRTTRWLQATWLRAGDELDLPAEKYHLLDPLQALALYLQAALRAHAEALFDLQRATEWLAAVQATHPASVAALERAGRGVAEVRLVGRALLREGVPLRERVSVVEAMGAAAGGLTAGELVEAVRPALARTITQMVAPDGVAEVIAMAARWRRNSWPPNG